MKLYKIQIIHKSNKTLKIQFFSFLFIYVYMFMCNIIAEGFRFIYVAFRFS